MEVEWATEAVAREKAALEGKVWLRSESAVLELDMQSEQVVSELCSSVVPVFEARRRSRCPKASLGHRRSKKLLGLGRTQLASRICSRARDLTGFRIGVPGGPAAAHIWRWRLVVRITASTTVTSDSLEVVARHG